MSRERTVVDLEHLLALTQPAGDDPDDCLIWTGSVFKGVPSINVPRSVERWGRVYVRRLVWNFTHESRIPPHRCAVAGEDCHALCVHPDHILNFSKRQVVQRNAARGLYSEPAHILAYTKAARQRANVKLTDDDVAKILASEDKPEVLAAVHGVSVAYIYMLRAGKYRRELRARPFDGLLAA